MGLRKEREAKLELTAAYVFHLHSRDREGGVAEYNVITLLLLHKKYI